MAQFFPIAMSVILIDSQTRPRGLLVVRRNLASSLLAGFQASRWISPPARVQICAPQIACPRGVVQSLIQVKSFKGGGDAAASRWWRLGVR